MFPLAVPMIAGPGTIATVLVLVTLAGGDRAKDAIVFAAFASAMLVTWICMRLSTRLLRVIGTTGIHVVTRLFGILLSALAVQFILNGLAQPPSSITDTNVGSSADGNCHPELVEGPPRSVIEGQRAWRPFSPFLRRAPD